MDEADYGDHADDATWVLTSSFVILTMQSGFAMLEMGTCSKGNDDVNIMLKNIFDVVCGALAYYMVGYGISYGTPSNGFMGLGDFFVDGDLDDHLKTGLLYSRYIFQFSFAATSTTIVSGCLAMRCRFPVYCIYSFYAVIVYGFVAHWVWAEDGWLRQLGVHDFAGSGAVSLLGAMNGLIGISMLGPRLGRFDGSRPETAFKPSSPATILFGLFMLWWGWIGFNCGSSFGITKDKWLVATRAGVSTINATAGGGLAALLYTTISSRASLVAPHEVANGMLGALVAITATCASVHTYAALIIGFVGSLIGLAANDLIFRWQLDDPVGAVGVHGASAIWGLAAVGFFADSKLPGIQVADGIFLGGSARLLGVQMLMAVCIIAWSLVTMVPFFYLVGIAFSRNCCDCRKGLRVDPEDELVGLDHVMHSTVPNSRRPTMFTDVESGKPTMAPCSQRSFPFDLEDSGKPTMAPCSQKSFPFSELEDSEKPTMAFSSQNSNPFRESEDGGKPTVARGQNSTSSQREDSSSIPTVQERTNSQRSTTFSQCEDSRNGVQRTAL